MYPVGRLLRLAEPAGYEFAYIEGARTAEAKRTVIEKIGHCQLAMGNKEQADRQKAVSDIVALENALDMCKLDNSRYPTTEQGLEALVTKPQGEPEPRNYKSDGYIKRLPQDPWGNAYQLMSPGEHGKIDVFSPGLDGEAGTDDYIGNWNMDQKKGNQ